MAAPQSVLDLVARFSRQREAYRSGHYNETQVRHEFIDPFFIALGYDVNNEKGYAEAYKDVIHEDAIKIGSLTKAPDYCFRIGGTRKFFLEAKKPSVDIRGQVGPAFQLRRYAWSAKLPLSILTDFEEFAVYDCRVKPEHTDRPATARIMYLTYEEYPERWDEIAGIFSREAVLQGSFDRYAEATKGKRGTAEVDEAFLSEIESWRELLAHNLALRNPSLTQRELNYAVQATIDRIVFLRICEDRGIEEYGQLDALRNGGEVYARLCQLLHRADARYNSGLFHFQHEKGRPEAPDELTPRLAVDDKPLKEIIARLYYPESPYELSVLPADILGQVYERFLGKVIRLTAGHRAVVEEKPEVRKAGGVYYTPTYIVDYIVAHTVGKLLEGKTPHQAARLRILDCACGSGSFLIGAYQRLLDWHLEQYVAGGAHKHTKELYQGRGGDWRLTTAERRRILLNNIYGVDIDGQAVEVTKLSLLLKVLEGESGETLNTQLRLFQERALPDLSANVKCGNSLIGPDFYQEQQLSFLDEEVRYRINAFDWQKEFGQVMGAGGFDAVIGNPPYVRMEGFKDIKAYLKGHYSSHDERSDLYVYFIERAHRLLKAHGRFGMIVSNKFLRANYGKPLREFLAGKAGIEHVVDFAGLPVFAGATVRTVIVISSAGARTDHPLLYSPPASLDRFQALASGSLSVADAVSGSTYQLPRTLLTRPSWAFAAPHAQALLHELAANGKPLCDYCGGLICMGVKSGLTEAFVIDEPTRAAIIKDNPEATEIIKPFLNGRDVRRYHIQAKGVFLLYTYHGVPIAKYPAVQRYLRPFKARLEKRATRQEWYELQQPQRNFAQYMDASKIIFPDIATSPRFALDDTGYYSSNTTYFIPRPDPYLLGLLNSRLAGFYFANTCAGLEGKADTYLRFFGQYLQEFPVRDLHTSDPADRARHDRMVALVEQMLALHRQLAAARTAPEKTALQRQIEAVDRQIDLLVYELYGLTEEEIGVVEGSETE